LGSLKPAGSTPESVQPEATSTGTFSQKTSSIAARESGRGGLRTVGIFSGPAQLERADSGRAAAGDASAVNTHEAPSPAKSHAVTQGSLIGRRVNDFTISVVNTIIVRFT
jgi:hypothetical protein